MRKYIYPILCTLLIVSQGCDHFLGNKPKGYAIPEAFEDYVKLFASQSLNSCMSTDAFYLTDDVHLLDDTVSAADLAYANQDDHERNLYSFKGGQIYTPGSDDNLWNAAYSTLLSTTCFPLPMPPMQKNIACAPKRSTSVLSNTWHWSTSTPAIITKKRQQPITVFL